MIFGLAFALWGLNEWGSLFVAYWIGCATLSLVLIGRFFTLSCDLDDESYWLSCGACGGGATTCIDPTKAPSVGRVGAPDSHTPLTGGGGGVRGRGAGSSFGSERGVLSGGGGMPAGMSVGSESELRDAFEPLDDDRNRDHGDRSFIPAKRNFTLLRDMPRPNVNPWVYGTWRVTAPERVKMAALAPLLLPPRIALLVGSVVRQIGRRMDRHRRRRSRSIDRSIIEPRRRLGSSSFVSKGRHPVLLRRAPHTRDDRPSYIALHCIALHCIALHHIHTALEKKRFVQVAIAILFPNLATIGWRHNDTLVTGRDGVPRRIVLSDVRRMPRWRFIVGWPARIAPRGLLYALGLLYVEVKGGPDPAARVMVANHLSLAEPTFFFYYLFCTPVASADFAKMPGVGEVGRLNQIIWLDRADPDARRRTRETLIGRARDGSRWPPIVIFPEVIYGHFLVRAGTVAQQENVFACQRNAQIYLCMSPRARRSTGKRSSRSSAARSSLANPSRYNYSSINLSDSFSSAGGVCSFTLF